MDARSPSVRNGYRRFLRSWLDDPRAVGALAPSGRPLAKLLTRELGPGDRVLELGPGTGTVTREILARGVAPADLVLVELGDRFVRRLRGDFPGVTVLQGNATEPQAELAGQAGCFDYVVSGLPLVLFSREQRLQMLGECLRLLNASGALFQFTYRGRCPVGRRELEHLDLVSRCAGFIALNVPPAFVYRLARSRSAVASLAA